MKIGIYLDDYAPGQGGASTLSDTIINEIKQDKDEYEYVIIIKGSCRAPYKFTDKGITYLNLNRARLKYIFRSKLSELSQTGSRLKCRLADRDPIGSTGSYWDIMCDREGLDLVWFATPAEERLSVPYISTVWDIGHRAAPYFPELSRPMVNWIRREKEYGDNLKRASYVITANETGKREIIENYSISPDRIRVIKFPVTGFSVSASEKKPDIGLPDSFFFYPAQFWPHKNHIRIVEAARLIREKYDIKINVVFTGSDKGNKDYIREKIREYGLEDQFIFAGFIASEEINYLYRHAKAMIFASLLGPNNLPPIEAAVNGCPLIISDIPGHVEQMGDAGLFFDGCDAEDLARKIMLVVNEDDCIGELKKRQERFVRDYQGYSYFSEIKKIFAEFKKIRETWGRTYIRKF
ncbi:MAG: glycosyltransferase family 4 protein [Lachnospiraceae bacterium]|nr:glycosyltransferase family 4 protein [Lachnospiraceae bacterium]